MRLLSLSFLLLLPLSLVFLSQFPLQSHSHQAYKGEQYLNCSDDLSTGYECKNKSNSACRSYLAFRARPPYDSPIVIGNLLGSDVSQIASTNKVDETEYLPRGTVVVVPITCFCWGTTYKYITSFPYRAEKGDTYLSIANDTYQGLSSCASLKAQNNLSTRNSSETLTEDTYLMVPITCACPTRQQQLKGLDYLLVYVVMPGDTLVSIGKEFEVSAETIMEANTMSANDTIYPFTPLLIPLYYRICSAKLSINCKDKGFPAKLLILLGVGIGFGLLCLVLLLYNFYKFHKRRKNRIRKENLFKQNGGLLLKEQCSSGGKARVFSAEEIERATDNFSENRILGQGGYGTVYKGMLLDGTIVAVKRAKAIDRSQIDQFINEVVVLSQINHRNVVNLLGCCLETEFPLLVYEFIPNGTLSSHIHQPDKQPSLPWESRLKIAAEVAGAVAYMHSASSIPIFHRDIKSTNILLDDRYSAKVSDFGTSRSVSIDKTHLTTAVKGTFGYLDPEYFLSSQFTSKSDVYSFGVVLLELLTGEKAISLSRDTADRNLVAYFRASWEENQILALLDPRVAKEAKAEDIFAVADLAMRCLRPSGIERPTMREVAMELEMLRKRQRCLPPGQNVQTSNFEATEESMDDSVIFSSDVDSLLVKS